MMLQPRKILLVSHDLLLPPLIRSILTHAGQFELREESKVRRALPVMWSFRPDLIALDLDVSPLSIDELFGRLRGEAALSGLPMILLSSFPDAAGIPEKAERLVPKPLHPLNLLAAIREVFAPKPQLDFATATHAGAKTLREHKDTPQFCAA
jgi:DNA-binding response OmpR family regulator